MNGCMKLWEKINVDKNLPSESFSPESGGRVKPRTAIEAMSMQGTIKLKK